MDSATHIIPAKAVKGVATGLLMMTFFTLLWIGIAYRGLSKNDYWFILLIFSVLCAQFTIVAIKLLKAAKYFPILTSDADIIEEKRMGKWFGIIFGAEGLLIFIAINIVVNLGHPDLTIPMIALVVGLHFFPLAKVFKRKIDYYIATWSTIIAILAIVFTLNKMLSENDIFVFTGIGMALATSCYGIYMMIKGKEILKMNLLTSLPRV